MRKSVVKLRAMPLAAILLVTNLLQTGESSELPALPESARLVLQEDWSTGKIDPQRWYVLRKKWGAGNHGVVPENIRIAPDLVDGKRRPVLVCTARGDRYDGDVVGLYGKSTRIGGVIVSKAWLASGRFEITMKIGSTEASAEGPANPRLPRGAVPAIWTYGYRYVEVGRAQKNNFVAEQPLYNPHMPKYGIGANEYWSELDFPEYGKAGRFDQAMYNTYCQNRHHPQMFDMRGAADGQYHRYTTEWRTALVPIEGVADTQVRQYAGFYWVCDKRVPFADYLGNPLRRLGPNRYAVYAGRRATHWIDGRRVATNTTFVPSMAAQLNLGVWLPDWAGPAPWKSAEVKFATVRVWQYDDPGDVRGVLKDDLCDNFDRTGKPIAGQPVD